MKKLILLFVLFFQFADAQVVISVGKKEIVPVEITLNDGTVENGFVKGFQAPRTIEFQGMNYDFSSIESQVYLDRPTFNFSKSEDGPFEKFAVVDVKRITLHESEPVTYERLKLKTVNTKLEVIDLNREILVPLIREGAINLYGFKLYTCSTACTLTFIVTYLKKPSDEFAINPLDFNRINFFNMGSLADKMMRAFEEVGNDCPAFLSYLKEQSEKFDPKESRQDYNKFQQERKATLKQIKDKDERKKMASKMDTDRFFKGFIEVIDNYSSNCP